MPTLHRFSCLALLCAAAPAAAQQPSFTLEQVLSAPFPDQLVTAKSGAIAWTFDAQGIRNIWAVTAPDAKARQVTSYPADDGQELTDLHFTPDGRAIVYVRGGGPNGRGEIPNPTSTPAGVEQAIWVVSLAGGVPRKLSDGSEPAVSPKGDQVAFVHGGQIWVASLADSSSAHQLVHARGGAASLTWSPDGSKLAFQSGRGRYGFIGVYDLGSKAISWMDPGVDQDLAPVWSPSGDRIAFVRIPASFDDFIFANQRSGEPWSVRVADVATGTGREVWRASSGTGSVFRELGSATQFFWAAGDRLVFPWEKDGWTHLYSVAVTGGMPTLLTPGEFEVEHVSLTSDGSAVLYSSNQGDIDRRHIWRVPAAGGTPVAQTSGTGLEWGPVPSGDGRTIAILRSDARGPARPAVLSGQGAPRDLAAEAIPTEFPRNALVEPEQVIFSAADGLKIHGQLFLPPGLKPGEKRPAVVFFHGGSQRQMLLGWHYMYYYHNAYGFNQYLASRGYVVLSVNYRSGIGYGMEFREALNYGAGGASEFNDVLGAGLYLRGRSDVDGARIGLWGGSYGGYLTAMGLSRASDLFAAGVDLHGVHDWNKVIENFVPVYNPSKDPERARVAYQSSPMASVGTWRSPVLLIHGDDDRNVPFTETVSLAAALRKQGVEFEQLIFPDDVHDFLLHRNWLRAYAAATDFLGRKLGR